jgi:SAM-dependent methyltransferase
MAASASEWNAKYRAAAAGPPAEPAEFVRELLPLLPLGPALDLACGAGRHTLLLASRLQPVTAVDSSDVALEMLEERAQASHYVVRRIVRAAQVAHRQHGIQTWRANLEEVNLPSHAFSLVVCVNYLQRSLFSQIERALVPGGLLLFETYTVTQL